MYLTECKSTVFYVSSFSGFRYLNMKTNQKYLLRVDVKLKVELERICAYTTYPKHTNISFININ